MLDGELAIEADFTWLGLQLTAKRDGYGFSAGNRAYRRTANTDDGPANRLPVEHFIEIDDARHLGERDGECAGHFGRNRLGNPAVDPLGRV
jgi:hypothetical protein